MLPLEFFIPSKEKSKIPFFENPIQAGFPSPAEDHVQLEIDLNRYLIKNPATTFLARVKGNSMQDVNINDGDILVVDRSKNWKINNIIVCILNGEFTVKTLSKDKIGYFLQSEATHSDEYPAKIRIQDEDDVSIWGVVTFIIHQT